MPSKRSKRRRLRDTRPDAEAQSVSLTRAVVGVLTKNQHLEIRVRGEVQRGKDILGGRKNLPFGPLSGYERLQFSPVGLCQLGL